MMAVELSFQCSTFTGKKDNQPRYRGVDWHHFVKGMLTHKERTDKDGPLWSPAIYRGKEPRGNAGVESISAGCGDFDDGATYESVKDRLAPYEYIVHTTYSHTPDDPHFRIIIPFVEPIPKADWANIKARIDEHLFCVANDQAVNDPSRIYYTPSCPPGAHRFAEHHEGELLDPTTLPPAANSNHKSSEPIAPSGDSLGPIKVQLGKTALDFVANGAPMGEQRIRGLAAARNYLSAGYSIEDTAAAIWRGLQASPQDPDRGPWEFADALTFTKDLDSKEAPPLKMVAGPVSPRMELQRVALGYVCSFPSVGVTIKVDRVKRTSDGIKAEIDISCSIPGVPAKLHWATLNFGSTTGRTTLSKALTKRAAPVDIDWDGIIEDVCRSVTAADRQGEPFVRLDTITQTKKPTWLVRNFIPQNQITTVFGEGGSGKSNFCLALGLTVATGQVFIEGYIPEGSGHVLYKDWETDESEIYNRAQALCEGIRYKGEIPITYSHCQRSLPDDIAETLAFCQENDVKLVIIDSVAMASAGVGDSGGDQNESIIKLYSALRLLNTTCLLIDHVSAADMEKKGPRKPYGSIYKINLARMAFDLRSTSKSTESPLHIALHNIKRNDGPLLKPVGLCVEFGNEFGVDFSGYVPETISEGELTKGMSGSEKVMLALTQSMRTIEELILITEENKSNIYNILSRGERKQTVFKELNKYGLISHKHKYGS
jgi:hypothetical protein